MGGLASGLDTGALISSLMAIERQPRGRLERQQAAVQARQDGLRDIATKLKALRNAAADLRSTSVWAPKREATSTDATRVGVRATGAQVTPGTYDVEVTQLATTESRGYLFRQRNTATTLDFTDSSGTQTTLNLAGNATIDDVIAQVNGSAAPVTARKDSAGNIIFDAKQSGAPGAFTVTSTGGGGVLDTPGPTTLGVDAQFTVNGAAHTSSSTFDTTAIPGVELTLAGLTTPGTPVKVTTTETAVDKASVAAKLKAFTDAYNAVVDLTRSKLTEKRVPNAATMTDAKKGVLFADGALNNVLSQLRRDLMDPLAVGNAANVDELHEIGLSTGGAQATLVQDKVNGKLTFDEAKFNAAWDDPIRRPQLERLLRGDGTSTGFIGRLEASLKPITDAGGLLDGRISAAGNELTRLSASLSRMDERLARKEAFLRRQFTSLETALQRNQNAGQQLLARLGTPAAS